MPAPANADELIELVRKSGVVEEARLNAYLQQLQSSSDVPTDVSKFSGKLVRDGILTNFQAEQFLLGKWKRFTIGKYKVLERLGSGGMGQVFLCEHKLMRRKVAVKVLPTAKADDSSSLDRFYREARAVAALDHPNIVRAYDIDQDESLHFLVMEHVDGISLQDLIKKFGPLDVTRACHYIYGSAIGLQHAHEAGLIHRDIKPGNILIDRAGTVKILDLGLARFFNDDDDMLTKKYDENVLGTADYLAPEQALDSHSVDGRADIYSLGATFYFMLTGKQPFTDGTVAQKLIWHQTRNPKSIREYRPEVPEGVAAVVEKMMAKDPDDRYQNPMELAEAMIPWIQTPIDPPPDREMPQLSAAAQAIGSSGPASMSVRVPPTPRVSSSIVTKLPIKPGAGSGHKGGRGSQSALPAITDESGEQQTKRRPAVAPIVETLPSNGEPAVWESLAADTNEAARDNTNRQQGAPKSGKPKSGVREPEPEPEPLPLPKSARHAASRGKKGPMPMLPFVIGGLTMLAFGLVFGVYWFVIRGPSKTPDSSQNAQNQQMTFTVARKEKDGQFATVKAALEKAVDGQVIVIMEPTWEEELYINKDLQKLKRITIQGAPNGTEWRVSAGRSTPKILQLNNTVDWKIRNINFTGNGETPNGIIVTGNVSGLVFENLKMADMRKSCIRFESCVASEGNPAIVQRVRFIANTAALNVPDTAVLFTASSNDQAKNAGRNEGIEIRDCRFEKKFTNGAIQIDASVADVVIKDNRFWDTNSGIFFNNVSRPGYSFKLKIENNTFFTLAVAGIRFLNAGYLAKKEEAAAQHIEVERNYFSRTPAVSKTMDNLTTFKFNPVPVDNARDAGCNDTAPALNSKVINLNPPLAALPDDDDAKFLRYPKTNALLNPPPPGKPIGAPPVD